MFQTVRSCVSQHHLKFHSQTYQVASDSRHSVRKRRQPAKIRNPRRDTNKTTNLSQYNMSSAIFTTDMYALYSACLLVGSRYNRALLAPSSAAALMSPSWFFLFDCRPVGRLVVRWDERNGTEIAWLCVSLRLAPPRLSVTWFDSGSSSSSACLHRTTECLLHFTVVKRFPTYNRIERQRGRQSQY